MKNIELLLEIAKRSDHDSDMDLPFHQVLHYKDGIKLMDYFFKTADDLSVQCEIPISQVSSNRNNGEFFTTQTLKNWQLM